MSWIKENQFVAVLGGATLVGAIALVAVGMAGSSKYQKASEAYQASADQVATYERLPLYPSEANRNGKTKALADYREEVLSLQQKFDAFRPAMPLENISPQELTTRVISSNAGVKSAFTDNGATVPDAFFLGFESYNGTLPREASTGILNYELEAATEMTTALAESKPTALVNFLRVPLPEEEGGKWEADKGATSRPLSFEITFSGSEESLREFLTKLSKSEKFYTVLRTIRVVNENIEPPKSTDAKFETPKTAIGGAAGAAAADDDPFGFSSPGDSAAPAAGGDSAAPATPAPSPERILSQVLGKENLDVFIRLDVLQFLPAKELPTISSPQ
ncbi:hypothetical protein JIN85_02075 [Luteolibacter pohnpeiensis]|uniref:Uncharacterized protein n=1 Tax=Luteolibacter pohnpeiensis TaxID=454153 RepID=A0A934VPM8_9BACT|nr:Amuc_1100 family pilus-like protein [Luteolibacter pohnpeiensis]MBK1881181.1 hypothetical protein [Luteolibacter pohnpeiensis]